MGTALNSDLNKLRAGYSGFGRADRAGRSRQVFWGGEGAVGGRNFGGTRGWRRVDGDLGEVRALIGLIGGFLRFLLGVDGQVRRIESEGSAERRGNASVSRARRKPWTLMAGRPGQAAHAIQSRAGGGLPPFAVALVSLPPIVSADKNSQTETDIRPLPRGFDAGEGREIPPNLMGSGVRAAQCARVNDRTVCRPKFSNLSQGLGWVRSCVRSVNEILRLGASWAHVN